MINIFVLCGLSLAGFVLLLVVVIACVMGIATRGHLPPEDEDEDMG